MANRVYSFKRTAIFSNYTASSNGTTSTGINAGLSFKLNDVPNASEFLNLYDMYKISAVKLVFRPTVNQVVEGVPNAGTQFGTGFYPFNSVIDYDDDIAPGSSTTMLQYQTLRTSSAGRIHTRTVRPKFSTRVFQTALADGFKPSTGWIDNNQPDVPHYGMKIYMDPPPVIPGASSSLMYTVYATYYLKFKSVR